jgi:pimeloyl-ACP methyl ester carboxylesterase
VPAPTRQRDDLMAPMGGMARSIGARGQLNQQRTMLARPASHADLASLAVPTPIACGREDAVTAVADHEAMRDCVPGARLEVIEHWGHLATIEQPARVTALLCEWLGATSAARGKGYIPATGAAAPLTRMRRPLAAGGRLRAPRQESV